MFAAVGIAFGFPACADDWKAPPREFKDPLGVDLSGNDIPGDKTFLTIGDPSAGGLSLTFHIHHPDLEKDWSFGVSPACDDPPPIFSDPSCDPSLQYILVWIGESATTFEPSGSDFINWSGTGSTLSLSGTTYTYTESDGTTYTFGGSGPAVIRHPNGMTVTVGGGTIVSNTGFALTIGSTVGTAKAVNMVAHGCNPCSVYDSMITLANSTDPDYAYQVTDPAGGNWYYEIEDKYAYEDPASHELVAGPRTLWAFKDPTGYAFSTTRGKYGGLTGFTDPRGTFQYSGQTSIAHPELPYTNTTKDPSGAVLFTSFMNLGYGIGGSIVDNLGRHTVYAVSVFDHGTSTVTYRPIAQWSRFYSVNLPRGRLRHLHLRRARQCHQCDHDRQAGFGLERKHHLQLSFDLHQSGHLQPADLDQGRQG
ncbi:MAG: hypothetical protein WDN06_16210 [Asticcacaulis sp.]